MLEKWEERASTYIDDDTKLSIVDGCYTHAYD
jgi:hypothetical protein